MLQPVCLASSGLAIDYVVIERAVASQALRREVASLHGLASLCDRTVGNGRTRSSADLQQSGTERLLNGYPCGILVTCGKSLLCAALFSFLLVF